MDKNQWQMLVQAVTERMSQRLASTIPAKFKQSFQYGKPGDVIRFHYALEATYEGIVDFVQGKSDRIDFVSRDSEEPLP